MDPHEGEGVKGPQINYPEVLAGVQNYEGIQSAMAKAIREMKQKGVTRIGFLSGRLGISRTMSEDMEEMRRMSQELCLEHKISIISSADIFHTVWNDLDETSLPETKRKPKMVALFNGILESGVTDIFLMEGWDKDGSGKFDKESGSYEEFKTARRLGLNIIDLDPTKPSEQL